MLAPKSLKAVGLNLKGQRFKSWQAFPNRNRSPSKGNKTKAVCHSIDDTNTTISTDGNDDADANAGGNANADTDTDTEADADADADADANMELRVGSSAELTLKMFCQWKNRILVDQEFDLAVLLTR